MQHWASAAAIAALVLAAGCYYPLRREPPVSARSQPPPSSRETYCGWYGDERDGVLYFGEAAFWSAYREHGQDPAADLRVEGPQLIGRFDLRRLALLEPLDVTTAGARSGVWDVLAHANGRVYFTTFFEESGWVDPESGEVVRLPGAGLGLNELAPGPEGSILASRYAGPEGADGSLVILDPGGVVRAEHALGPVAGHQVAPKTVAWDPRRGEYWVNTDLIPRAGGTPRHDARILDGQGRELLRLEAMEVQFVAFRPDGFGIVAEVDEAGLWLRVLDPGDAEPMPLRGTRFLADEFFDRSADFVQDIQFASDGRAVVMRWSGRLHVVDPGPPLSHTLSLPRLSDGLFYTGVLHGTRLCATLCREISVVCRDVAPF